jgi:hypothetical protein
MDRVLDRGSVLLCQRRRWIDRTSERSHQDRADDYEGCKCRQNIQSEGKVH